MLYKYSNHFKFILMIITGIVASCSTIVMAYMVQTLTNIATQKKWNQVSIFLAIVIGGFLITFIASLIFNRLKTAAIQETNTYLRTNIFKGMLSTDRDENSNALGFLTNVLSCLKLIVLMHRLKLLCRLAHWCWPSVMHYWSIG